MFDIYYSTIGIVIYVKQLNIIVYTLTKYSTLQTFLCALYNYLICGGHIV